VKLAQADWLADENIDTDVVAFLRGIGCDIQTVHELGKSGVSDVDLLREAVAHNRIVVTHDSDFGTLAIVRGEPVTGIVYLRPGHIDPRFTIESLRAVLDEVPEVTPPFIIVARRKGTQVSVRIRQL